MPSQVSFPCVCSLQLKKRRKKRPTHFAFYCDHIWWCWQGRSTDCDITRGKWKTVASAAEVMLQFSSSGVSAWWRAACEAQQVASVLEENSKKKKGKSCYDSQADQSSTRLMLNHSCSLQRCLPFSFFPLSFILIRRFHAAATATTRFLQSSQDSSRRSSWTLHSLTLPAAAQTPNTVAMQL